MRKTLDGTKYQRFVVHLYRNIFSVVPRSKMKAVAKMLKAIHSQENKKAAREKAKVIIEELKLVKLKEAADKLEKGIEETLTYMAFPYEHWLNIRTTNLVERINRKIKRRTRVVGTFPDGNSALMLVCIRLHHVTGTNGRKNIKHLENLQQRGNRIQKSGRLTVRNQVAKLNLRKILDGTNSKNR